MKNIKLSILIPVYGQSNFTRSCLKDLSKLPKDHEIIVYDNCSLDNTEEVMNEMTDFYKDKDPSFMYLKGNTNTGFSYANNQMYNISSGENVLFFFNDIRVKSNFSSWTKKINKLSDRGYLCSPDVGLLNNDFLFVREGKDIDIKNKLSYLVGWCLGGSKLMFDKLILNYRRCLETNIIRNEVGIGPWNEMFRLYFEDGDLTFRAREIGIKMKVINVPVYHFGRITGKTLNMYDNYLESREIFIKEWKEKINV